MSSWLARTLANSLRLDEDDDNDNSDPDDEDNEVVLDNQCGEPSPSSPTEPHPTIRFHHEKNRINGIESEGDEDEEEGALNRGVKEDLSEFKQALTRQFWGVASFLAPPPSQPSMPTNLNWDRSALSDQSDRVPVTPLKEEEEEEEGLEEECYMEDALGITDEVLAFARNIAMHPETWLDFPLDEEEDLDDFDVSDAQQEHALAIEHLAPRLAALRIELCPCHMSESYFWKVYFVLLHSRLNKKDAETLSTPQLMAARAKWMQELQNHTSSDSEWYGRSTSCLKESTDFLREDLGSVSSFDAHCEDTLIGTFPSQSTSIFVSTAFENDKDPVEGSELEFVDKSVIEEKPVVKTEDKSVTVGPSSNILVKYHEDDEDDDWPEEDFEFNEYSGTSLPVGNEDDISFSDLEDDDFQAPTR
ncbi:BSD domain containing protein [Parasponia andersonii]|uniref:BSD domain containing protein n=1 Tax=Parasponia andersonii TaxID=3476 RepID=A0A2P5CWW4_PARAD|nr:BSD domain containing protein [Parasponia andersonii]